MPACMIRSLAASASALALTVAQIAPARAEYRGPVTLPQTPAYTGDVAKPAGSGATTIQPGAVTSGKMGAGAAAGNIGTLGGDLQGSLPSPTVNGKLSRAASMGAVAAFATTAFPLEVDGTTTAGDGGRRKMTFDSANPCGAGGHPAADGYTCVNSTVVTTGSWNIDWGSVNYTANPVLYGAKFLGGTTSSADTAALQAALSSGQRRVRVPALGGNLVLSACLNITLNGQLIDFDDVGNGAGLSVNVGTNLQTSQVPNCKGIFTYAAGAHHEPDRPRHQFRSAGYDLGVQLVHLPSGDLRPIVGTFALLPHSLQQRDDLHRRPAELRRHRHRRHQVQCLSVRHLV